MYKRSVSLLVFFALVASTLLVSNPAIAQGMAKSNQFWWPNQVDLSPLRQHGVESNPMGDDFDYAAEFATLDLAAVKQDIEAVMTDSQDWWPADYGHYGPFFIRMAWHSAGTYRTLDGRGGAGGGQQRFEPLNSWPDNANLDKARRLAVADQAEIRQQHFLGRPDGAHRQCRAGIHGIRDLWICRWPRRRLGSRTRTFTGDRKPEWLADERYSGRPGSRQAAGAVQMGLIYVNPEGPNGNPDPVPGWPPTFARPSARMAMNDEETVR